MDDLNDILARGAALHVDEMATKMKLSALLLVFGAGIITAAEQSTAVRTAGGALERRVDALFNSAIRPDGPGCAVGIYQDGRTVLSRGYGLASREDGRPITASTVFGCSQE